MIKIDKQMKPWHKSNFRQSILIILVVVSFAYMISSMNQWRENLPKIEKARADLNALKAAFNLYFATENDYPPLGKDHCSACSDALRGEWIKIADSVAQYTNHVSLTTDPWGHYYAYDKNYKQPGWNAWSVLCSAGPNGILETKFSQQDDISGGDDVCVFFPDSD